MEKIYIFGHRSPDTDSVTAAISLAYLKNKQGLNTVPVVLSSINSETKFALDYFNVKEPLFINDISLKIKDLKYTKNYNVQESNSIYDAYLNMEEHEISKVPVIDSNKRLLGIVSMKDIAKDFLSGKYNKIETSYSNIIKTIEGKELTKYDEEIKGNLIVASYKSTTFMEEVKLEQDNILIVGDRHSIIEYAIKSKVKLIVITGNHDIKEEHLKLAKKNKVNVIKSSYDALHTTKIFNLCNYCSVIMDSDEVLCISENEKLSTFIDIANKTRYSYYPVLGKNDECLGILRYSDISSYKKKKVILVDHNSYEQSAVGLDEAEILEVVDHHNIGTIGTNSPINFRNMPVGSTNTLIFIMYKERDIEIPKEIAGMMLSGIISDTMLLTSPTTTELDEFVVKELARISGIDYSKYGYDMLKAGCSFKGKTKEEILHTDFKIYPVGNHKIGLGQVSTTNFDDFSEEIEEYIKLLNHTSESNNYLFTVLFVTDIIKNGTYVIYSDMAKDVLSGAFKKKMEQGVFLKGIVSRKKQILPNIMLEMENR